MTRNQKRVFEYFPHNHLVLHGMAGTGKSFLSLYLSLQSILAKKSPYLKIVVVRSAVPTRDIGFLPGSLKEKIEAYEEPYKIIVSEIFGRGDAYGILKNKGQIEFVTTSYLRGITLDDCIVIVDEFQNCTFQELDTIITRIGENGKIIFSGDYRQSDLDKSRERAGMIKFLDILEKMYEFEFVEFEAEDIVRSGLVKSYIISKSELEDQLKNSA
jgi:phosphate starvation-inducible protein PhoH